MTKAVHTCPVFSDGYGTVGRAVPRNPSRIVMLRFPEWEVLTTRVHPRLKATKESLT
jgi:hypothetical protein